MDYNVKLKRDRFRPSTAPKETFDDEMESDRGRAINSAAVRRLQQKTQVFPLESNSAVRSRLTHSLEVQQVGRFISKLILKKIKQRGELKTLGLDGKEDGFISAVEIACLLHDIGNPPFGHFGEEAINHWSKKKLKKIFVDKFGKSITDSEIFKDLMIFEGNAQAIRLLHSIQELNLTFSQVACLIKYTRSAHESKPGENDDFFYRKKKPGYYFSEKDYVSKLCNSLQIDLGCRFPLAYIMEAADDISYCIADLDDAIDKKILNVEQLHEAICNTWQSFGSELGVSQDIVDKGYLPRIAQDAYVRCGSETHNKSHAYILTLRTKLINDLANYASDRYLDNHQAVFDGSLDESLLDGNDEYNLATETLKTVAKKYVFSAKEVERLELKGHAIISGLLNIYTPLLELGFDEFKVLSTNDVLKSYQVETRLYHGLSNKQKRMYIDSTKYLFDKENISEHEQALELYFRARLLIDYVSGMTDRFALEEYRSLSAIG
ncbi:dGTPase [Vibrio salinus]|uniref:dGTPase n=1 Tax=Vibrio salinus TaxID=2899784 RepID=UPI001E49ADB4|nr:dGTPase [Vibrio salinus]MCE0494651.1 dGTPase [Vibrio salinus]